MSYACLLILGFGGHARSVADVALSSGMPCLRFYDVSARVGEQFNDFPAIAILPKASAILCIDNGDRRISGGGARNRLKPML